VKYRPHRDSTSGRPGRSSVAIPTELPSPLTYILYKYIGWEGNFVGIYTKLGAGRSGIPIQAKAREFYLLQTVRIVSETHTTSYSMGARVHSDSGR